MRWNKTTGSGAVAVSAALILLLLARAPSAEERRLAVYTRQQTFHFDVVERENVAYAGFQDILERLGPLSARQDGRRWRLRFGRVDGELAADSAEARVGGARLQLAAKIVDQDGRPLVPLASLPVLLARFTGMDVSFHGGSRRLFLGGTATRFTAELSAGTAPSLVLNFSAPVNPMIATEPGKLKMVFTRDPVVSAAENFNFSDKQITSAAYSESNGRAEVAVAGTVPLMATFSNGGRTITIAPAPAVAGTTPAPAPPAAEPAPRVEPPAAAQAATPLPLPAPRPRFLVVIDAGHGGDDRGAMLGELTEKEVTLAVARRLRSELQARGISSVMVRDHDAAVALDSRAELANSARATAYVSIHAGAMGSGVRVYTPLSSGAPAEPQGALPWESAQTGFTIATQALAEAIAAELEKKRLLGGRLPAPVRPLNNVAAAAVVVEVAPARQAAGGVMSVPYQQNIATAIASGLEAARPRLERAR